MKVCSKCKQELPKSSFYRGAIWKDGLRPSCKVCDTRSRDKKKRAAYEKEYWSRPDRKVKKAATMKRSREKKLSAYTSALNAYRQTERFKINHRMHAATRRTRCHMAFVEHVDYEVVFAEAGGKCFYCGKALTFKDAEFDHYIPIAKGGLHKKDNIRCSCLACNRTKGAKLPEEVGYQMV